jgi:hypothetical protein
VCAGLATSAVAADDPSVFVCYSANQPEPTVLPLDEAAALDVRPFNLTSLSSNEGQYWQPFAIEAALTRFPVATHLGSFALACAPCTICMNIPTGHFSWGEFQTSYDPVFRVTFASGGVALRKFVSLTGCTAARGRPDRDCTPGVVLADPDEGALCRREYTNQFALNKIATASVLTAYSLRDLRGYRIAHLVSLRLGGTNDSANLWPIPTQFAAAHARLEQRLSQLVCSGKLTVRTARRLEARDWRAAAKRLHI